MRVLTVSRMFPRPENPLSGVFVLEQLKSLREKGIRVSVVCPIARPILKRAGLGRGDEDLPAEVDGIPVRYAPYPHLPLRLSTRFESWSLVRHLLPVLRDENRREPIDIVHAHQLYPTGYGAVVAARALGIPSVCTAHGSDVHTHPERNQGTRRYTRATLRMADRTVAVSRDLAQRMASLEPAAPPAHVVYNGIDPARFADGADQAALRSRLGLPAEGLGLCFVGRLVEAKGLHELIEALREVVNGGADIWLAVVGPGPLEAWLKSQTAVAGLSHRVVVAGPVPHDQVAEYLNACDAFILPSHGEGVPVSMLEAMACGLPVIATRVGGIPEVVIEGSTGFLVPPRDVDSLVDAIQRLLRDPTVRARMGTAARDRIRSGFQWSHGTDHLLALYRELGGAS